MWQSSKGRLGFGTKKKPKKALADVHLRRVPVEIKVLPKGGPVLGGSANAPLVAARVLLTEVNEAGLYLFAKEPLESEQPVAVTFEIPRRIYLKGVVTYCDTYSPHSNIISDNRFDFRVQIQFLCETDEDKKSLQEFCTELQTGKPGAIIAPSAAAAPVAADAATPTESPAAASEPAAELPKAA